MIRKGAAGAEAVDQATEMTTVTDPFLGQTGSSTDHSRQESADSGLGESDSLHQSIDSVAGTSGLLIVFKTWARFVWTKRSAISAVGAHDHLDVGKCHDFRQECILHVPKVVVLVMSAQW